MDAFLYGGYMGKKANSRTAPNQTDYRELEELAQPLQKGQLFEAKQTAGAQRQIINPHCWHKLSLTLSFYLCTLLPESSTEWSYMNTVIRCTQPNGAQAGNLILGAIPIESILCCCASSTRKYQPHLNSGDLVINMTNPFETEGRGFWGVRPVAMESWQNKGVDVYHCPMLDFSPQSSRIDTIQANLEMLDKMAQKIQAGHQVYVHCKAGRSRSLLALLCFLVRHTNLDADEAMRLVKARRPQVDMQSDLLGLLRRFKEDCSAQEKQLFTVRLVQYHREASFQRAGFNAVLMLACILPAFAIVGGREPALLMSEGIHNHAWSAGGISTAILAYGGATYLPNLPLRSLSLFLSLMAIGTVLSAYRLAFDHDTESDLRQWTTPILMLSASVLLITGILQVWRDAAKERTIGTPNMTFLRDEEKGFAP